MDIIYYTLLGLYRDDDGRFFFEILFGDYDKDMDTARIGWEQSPRSFIRVGVWMHPASH